VAGGRINVTLSEIVSGGGTVAQSLVVIAFRLVGPGGMVILLQLLGMVPGSTLGSVTGYCKVPSSSACKVIELQLEMFL